MTDRGGRLHYEISVDAEETEIKTLFGELKGIHQTRQNKRPNRRVNTEDIVRTGDGGSYQADPGKTCNATNVMSVHHSASEFRFTEHHYFGSDSEAFVNSRSQTLANKMIVANARNSSSRFSNHNGRGKLALRSWSLWALCLFIHVLKTAAQGKEMYSKTHERKVKGYVLKM